VFLSIFKYPTSYKKNYEQNKIGGKGGKKRALHNMWKKHIFWGAFSFFCTKIWEGKRKTFKPWTNQKYLNLWVG
jgi:hypothetical protein